MDDGALEDALWSEEPHRQPSDASVGRESPDAVHSSAALQGESAPRPARKGCSAVAAGPATEPHPNACAWWQEMHEQHVADIKVGGCRVNRSTRHDIPTSWHVHSLALQALLPHLQMRPAVASAGSLRRSPCDMHSSLHRQRMQERASN